MSAHLEKTPGSCSETSRSQVLSSGALPPCCHSGCTVCVLDYPELFLPETISTEEMALLEAIEQAMAEASKPVSQKTSGTEPAD
jgi:hypothetical protein